MTIETLDYRTSVHRRVLDPMVCDWIIEEQRPLVRLKAPEIGGGSLRNNQDVPEQKRLYQLMHEANEYFGWRIPLDIARFGCSAYFVGDSMGEHVDDHERGPMSEWTIPHRGVSISVQLSDPGDFVGGELRTRNGAGEWSTAQLAKGDALVFGSSLPHEVTRVMTGERWALLAWGYCDHFRRPIR